MRIKKIMSTISGCPKYRIQNNAEESLYKLNVVSSDVKYLSPLVDGDILIYDAKKRWWFNGSGGGVNPNVKFFDLIDVNEIKKPLSLYRVNSTGDAYEEIDAQISLPAPNQFKITSGTTDLTCTTDCTINQDLSTTSSPTFYFLNSTRCTSTDFHTGVPPAGGNRYIRTGVGDFMCGIEFQRDNEAIGIEAKGDVRVCLDAGNTSLYRKFEICHNHYGWSANNYCFTVEETGNVKLYGRLSWNGESTYVASIKDEDDMTSNSDHALPTQQSVKAYVDSFYTSGTVSTTFTGPWAADITVTCRYSRSGNIVSWSIPEAYALATTNSVITTTTAVVPAALRPATQTSVGVLTLGIVPQISMMIVNTDGTLEIRDRNQQFTAGYPSGVYVDWTVSWNLS